MVYELYLIKAITKKKRKEKVCVRPVRCLLAIQRTLRYMKLKFRGKRLELEIQI